MFAYAIGKSIVNDLVIFEKVPNVVFNVATTQENNSRKGLLFSRKQ